MNEEVQMMLDMAKESMDGAIEYLINGFTKIRAGKADVHILDGVMVDYYGTNTAINQVANLHTPDPRQIVIQPWEKAMIQPIEKAIQNANIGINPVNNGELIRLNIPPLTEERRKTLVKQVKTEGENAKVSVRNSRRDAIDEIKKMKKDGLSEDIAKDLENEIQKLTNVFTKRVDELVDKKENDIMTI